MASSSFTSAASDERLASHQLRHLVDELDRVLRDAADSGDQHIEQARDRLRKQLGALRDQVSQFNGVALERIKQAASRTDEQVHAHPYGAMGLAAATGLLVGFLASRR